MAATASHEHRQKQFLPPTPPPSPSIVRRRHKRHHDDEFAKLAATPLPSPSLSAAFDEDKPEPLLQRIILTPVLFTSFLISLFLVNAHDRARRTAAHASLPSYLKFLFPSSWINPEPYQDYDDSTWGRWAAARHVEPNIAIGPKPGQLDGTTGANKEADERKGKRTNSWHLNKKIRKMTRLEVSDAFESQGKVIIVMVIMMGFSVMGFWVGMRWIWRSVFG